MMPAPGEPSREKSPPGTDERTGLRPVRKPHSVRRLGPVDVTPLRALVARLSDKAWNRENTAKENDFSCFTHTRHVVFRFIPLDSARPSFYSMPPVEPLAALAAARHGPGWCPLRLHRSSVSQGHARPPRRRTRYRPA